MKKSKKMLQVEKRFDLKIEDAIPEMITEHGLTGASEILEIDKNTLNYWLMKMNCRVERVVLKPDQKVLVVKA